MICKNCERENKKGSNFCKYCGCDLEESSNNVDKSDTIQKVIIFVCCIVILVSGIIIFKFNFGGNDKSSYAPSHSASSDIKDDKKENNEDTQSTDLSEAQQDSNSLTEAQDSQESETTKQVSNLYIESSSCSSILHDSTNKDYGSTRVLDGDFSTVWSEGASGYGKGEWLQLNLGDEYTIKKIKIVNGLVNKKNGYYNNNRPQSLILEFSDGSSQEIYLEDDNTGYQVVEIDPVKSSYVRFVIDSVYSGSKYNDTCIADVEILGY